MADLPTNLKDDILDSSVNTRRRYRMIENSDGTVEFEDATEYSQVGDEYGAGLINETNKQVNARVEKAVIVRDLDTIGAITQEGFIPDALALKDVNESLKSVKTYVGEDGKLHFVDSEGADTVLPFSSMKRFFADSITFSSTEKTYELGFRPKFFLMGVSGTNVCFWYDSTQNKHFYNSYITKGANVGEAETASGNKLFTLMGITDTGFSAKTNSSYNNKSGFIIAFGGSDSSVSKNLLKSTATSQTQYGVTFTVNDDLSITANGTATSDTDYTVTLMDLTEGETYILSGGVSESARLVIYYKNDWQQLNVYSTGNDVEFTAPHTGQYRVYIRIVKDVTLSNKTFYPMLRHASITDDTYEPYR